MMKIRSCPTCHQHSLVFTGAFWSCAVCGLAVTDQALAFDLAGRQRARDKAVRPSRP
jgi:ribosomal protein L37AE/L43A